MLWLRAILTGVALFIQLLALVMVLDFAVIWLLPQKHIIRVWLGRVTDPLLGPLRRFLDRRLSPSIKRALSRLPIDVSPIVAVLILQLLRSFVLWLAALV